jgi:exonuclease III
MNWLYDRVPEGGGRRTTLLSPEPQLAVPVQREDTRVTPTPLLTTLQKAQAQWHRLLSRTNKTEEETVTTPRSTALNVENSRTNNPWGDECQGKEPNVTRVYAINLNGLQLDKKGGKFDSVCRYIKEIQADVFCGQEHNVDTTQASVRNILFNTSNQHWERSRIVVGTSPIPFQTPFIPGGTMVMTVGSLTGRLCKQDRDKWGRWSSRVFQGRAGRKVAIISAYQPIVKGGIAGKITVAAQHVSLLLKSEDKITNPRVAFRRDLSKWLKEYQDDGCEILLIGDFNEALGTDPDGMSKIASDHHLLDIMASRHSSAPPATYARGSKRLD